MFHNGDQIGPYTLLRELGRGRYGVVWLAERRTPLATMQFALKIPLVDEPDLQTIKREAQLWVKASGHPNVLPVIEADLYDRYVVIVSEYAPDGSLLAWLKRHGGKAPSLDSATTMILGILAGLAHLHAKLIIHRDLKPGNILLQGEVPRIADFGLARVLGSDTQTYGVAGTPPYMAPEAWDGQRSERSDIWSTGVILYEMLTGHLPFPDANGTALWKAIRENEPAPLPTTVPLALVTVINRALQKNPDGRYPTAVAMATDIRAQSSFLAPTVIARPKDPSPPAPEKRLALVRALDPSFRLLRTKKTVQDSKRGRHRQELLDEILGQTRARLLTARLRSPHIDTSGAGITAEGFAISWSVTKLQQQWYFRVHYTTEITDLSVVDGIRAWHPWWHPASVDEIELITGDAVDISAATARAMRHNMTVDLVLDNRIRVSSRTWDDIAMTAAFCVDLVACEGESKIVTTHLPYGVCDDWLESINLLIRLGRWLGSPPNTGLEPTAPLSS